MTRRAASREKLVEACAVIALAVLDDSKYAAAMVQRMLIDPAHRAYAMTQALSNVTPACGQAPTADQRAAAADIHDACDRLRAHTGRPI